MKTLPQRKSPRLQNYDYSQAGAYFVTICCYQRQYLFGNIVDGEMTLNAVGKIAFDLWEAIPQHYPDLDLDAFIVMPNHVHGILCLFGDNKAFKTVLGRVINGYKGAVTASIRQLGEADKKVWQSRFHDHIIRNERSLNYIREYVANNQQRWEADTFYQ